MSLGTKMQTAGTGPAVCDFECRPPERKEVRMPNTKLVRYIRKFLQILEVILRLVLMILRYLRENN